MILVYGRSGDEELVFVPVIESFFWGGCTPEAYGGSQAWGRIEVTAATLCHSHSHTGSKLSLQPTPQLTATPDP